jgi:hypothetical protein
MTTRRPRLALAVEPPVLCDALAQVLTTAGVDEVVNVSGEGADGDGVDDYDVVVTSPSSVYLSARIVISLPEHPGEQGWVEADGVRMGIDIASLPGLLKVLDRWCPGDHDRRDVVDEKAEDVVGVDGSGA